MVKGGKKKIARLEETYKDRKYRTAGGVTIQVDRIFYDDDLGYVAHALLENGEEYGKITVEVLKDIVREEKRKNKPPAPSKPKPPAGEGGQEKKLPAKKKQPAMRFKKSATPNKSTLTRLAKEGESASKEDDEESDTEGGETGTSKRKAGERFSRDHLIATAKKQKLEGATLPSGARLPHHTRLLPLLRLCVFLDFFDIRDIPKLLWLTMSAIRNGMSGKDKLTIEDLWKELHVELFPTKKKLAQRKAEKGSEEELRYLREFISVLPEQLQAVILSTRKGLVDDYTKIHLKPAYDILEQTYKELAPTISASHEVDPLLFMMDTDKEAKDGSEADGDEQKEAGERAKPISPFDAEMAKKMTEKVDSWNDEKLYKIAGKMFNSEINFIKIQSTLLKYPYDGFGQYPFVPIKAVEELLFTAPTMKPTKVKPIYKDAILGVLRAAIPYIIEDKGKKATHRSKSDRVTGIYSILEEMIKSPYKIMPVKTVKLSKNLSELCDLETLLSNLLPNLSPFETLLFRGQDAVRLALHAEEKERLKAKEEAGRAEQKTA